MKKLALSLLAITFSLPGATMISQVSGKIDLLVLQDAGTFNVVGFDVRNTAQFSVASGPLTGSSFFLTDGTPLGFPSPAVGNTVLIGLNGGITEGIFLTLGNFQSPASGVALLDAVFVGNLTAVTDPVLQYLSSNVSTLEFSYVPDSAVLIGDDTQILSSWVSTGMTGPSEVPEPATFALLSAGLLGLVALKRRH